MQVDIRYRSYFFAHWIKLSQKENRPLMIQEIEQEIVGKTTNSENNLVNPVNRSKPASAAWQHRSRAGFSLSAWAEILA